MIDVGAEEMLSLKRATMEFVSRPTATTVRRWIKVGLRVDGEFVFLEATRIGGRIYTSRQACRRFIQATSGVN